MQNASPRHGSPPFPRHHPSGSRDGRPRPWAKGGLQRLSGLWAFFFAAAHLFISPESAEAVQPHGEPEGLVAHQLGHILFAGGMLFLLVHSRRSRWAGPGWCWFKCFLGLAVAWNILTFIGHLLHLATDKKELVTVDGRTVAMVADSLSDLLFYLAKLDHVLLLPCLFFLALALKKWMKNSEWN